MAAVAAAAAPLLTADDDATGGPQLRWDGTPEVVRVPELPRDRVLVGRIRNASLDRLSLAADDVTVVDGSGRRLEATARFAAGFGHALYSPTDPPAEVARDEQLRLGTVAELEPGGTAPLTLSWRLPEGADRAAEARVGQAVLRLP